VRMLKWRDSTFPQSFRHTRIWHGDSDENALPSKPPYLCTISKHCSAPAHPTPGIEHAHRQVFHHFFSGLLVRESTTLSRLPGGAIVHVVLRDYDPALAMWIVKFLDRIPLCRIPREDRRLGMKTFQYELAVIREMPSYARETCLHSSCRADGRARWLEIVRL